MAKLGPEVLDSILAAAMTDPDAMRQFANDISPPAEPVQDYLTEVDTRRALFDELREICQHYDIRLDAAIFAVFMVAPVSEIRTFLEDIRNIGQTRFATHTVAMVYGTITLASSAIRACTLLFSPLIFPSFPLIIQLLSPRIN